MPRERRSLWGSISTSRKVNAVSVYAALLYTWMIPHYDDEGYIDGEIEYLKAKIVPMRQEYTRKMLSRCLEELEKAQLLLVFRGGNRIIIYDPAFETHQIFKAIKKIPSKLRPLVIALHPKGLTTTPQEVDHYTLDPLQEKLSEVKGSEVKGSEEGEPFIPTIKSTLKSTLDQEVKRIKKLEQEKGHYL